MNESELEESLRALRPTMPSPGLEERVAQGLRSAATGIPAAGVIVRRRGEWNRLWEGLAWACGGAFAAVALLLAVFPRASVTGPSANPPAVAASSASSLFEPSESAREVVSTEVAGTVYDSENQPSQLMRYTSIERHTWLNPSTGAQVAVEVPREDLVAIPAVYQ